MSRLPERTKKTSMFSLYATIAIGQFPPPGGYPIHYLYGYVPPKGVVILKLLI